MIVALNETVYLDFITSDATGAAADADSTPGGAVFEDDGIVGIVSLVAIRRALGHYYVAFIATAVSGFDVGKYYNVVVTATVGGILAKKVVGTFQLLATRSGLTITPLLANTNNPRYSTVDLPPIAQYSAPTEIFTIVDANGDPVDLTGKDLRVVVYSVGTEAEDCDEFDADLTAVFEYETGSGLTLGGADDNQVTLVHDDTNTATSGNYRYFLWNITDNIVLAKGRMPIEPAVVEV